MENRPTGIFTAHFSLLLEEKGGFRGGNADNR